MTAGVAAPSDRRFRRPDVRPWRRRPASRVVRLVVRLGLPMAVLAGVAFWAGRAALASDLLRVDEVVVRGVDRLIEGLRGSHILQVDLDAYRGRLQASPWVSTVTVSRLLPSTVIFEVEERRPMAVARLGQQLYLIDRTGVVLERDGPEHRDLDLPIVDGLAAGAPEPGATLDNQAGVQLVGAFLRSMVAAPTMAERVSQIDASNGHDLVILLDGDPAWLHLGEEAFVERLERYLAWAPALRDRMDGLDYVDLRFGERLVVRAGGRRTEWSRE
jgi:cell division protein FtsQ